MGIHWTTEGPRQAITTWKRVPFGTIQTELSIGLAACEAGVVMGAIDADLSPMIPDADVENPGPMAMYVPDETELPALILHRHALGTMIGLAARPEGEEVAIPADVDWLEPGSGDLELSRVWGRFLSARSAWRLALARASEHPGRIQRMRIAPGLDAVTVALSPAQRDAIAAAAEGASEGALAIIAKGLDLEDPALMELAESPDVLVGGLLSSAPESGGYRTWAGPLTSALEGGEIVALVVVKRPAIRALVDATSPTTIPFAPSDDEVLFAAAMDGVTLAEAVALLHGHHQAREVTLVPAITRLEKLLGEDVHIRPEALDRVHIARGERSLEINLDAVMQKLDDDVDGEGLAESASAIGRALAEDAGAAAMIDTERSWCAMHLRHPSVLSEPPIPVVTEEIIDDLGTTFALVGVVEDPRAVLQISEAVAAEFGGVAAVRARIQNDWPHTRISVEAEEITSALGERAAVALIGSNIATALAHEESKAEIVYWLNDILPGASPLMAIGVAAGLVIVFRPEHLEAAITGVDALLVALGPRTGGMLGFLAHLPPDGIPGHGMLHIENILQPPEEVRSDR